MKFLILILMSCLAVNGFAQTVTPPAHDVLTPSVGDSRLANCDPQDCFQINIQTSCFGTNLRAYDQSVQMTDVDNLLFKVKLGTDLVNVKFPAKLTFAPLDKRVTCLPVPGQNMNTAGSRNFKCTNDKYADVTYTVADWRGSKNPSCYANGGSHGQVFCDYASRVLEATTTAPVIDLHKKVICLYSFNSSYQMLPEVSCLFNNDNEKEDSKVQVTVGGVAYNPPMDAYYNSIALYFPINKLPGIAAASQPADSEAQREMPQSGQTLITPSIDFFQLDGGTVERNLENKGAGYELADKVIALDEVNRNMSLRVVAKFPGKDGFCGGFYSPLMLFFDKKLPKFNGVSLFPLHGVKEGGRVNWPEAGASGYFLALMEKGDSDISKASQLFGQDDKNANGFEALKKHDSDKNGVINNKDKAWKSLKLWNDENSNGLSERNEIHSLSSKGVESINLNYSSGQAQKFGDRARIRERSTFSYKAKGKVKQADILDVWLSPID